MPLVFTTTEELFDEDDDSDTQPCMHEERKVQEQMKPDPAKFMPYSRSELTKELIEYAEKNIGETEEIRIKALKEMRDYVEKDLKVVDVDIEDNYFLCFLRSRKFDVKRACELSKMGYDFVVANRRIFDRNDVDTDIVRKVIETKVVGFLPYRDAKGRAILLVRSECWKPEEISAEDLIYGVVVSLFTAGENEVNQVAGYVVIVDFKNLSAHQAVAMSTWVIFGLQALQKCCPCLVKEFHVVHTPAVFRTFWKIVRNFLSEKIKSRITIYKSAHWERLHNKIPPEILPEELGGYLGPCSYEHWATDIKMMEKKYKDKVRQFFYGNGT